MGRDPELWVVVMIPDPVANGWPSPDDIVLIGADDTGEPMRPIAYKDLAAELNDQNHYRWSLGLYPLPDLARVTHKRPATSPGSP